MNPEQQGEISLSEEWSFKFESFLHEYYSEVVNPTCLDDMLPDCTADWIGDLGSDEMIKLTGIFISKHLNDSVPEVTDLATEKAFNAGVLRGIKLINKRHC